MNSIELIERSKAVADLVWNAVEVSVPYAMGKTMRHTDVSEDDHRKARNILSGDVTARMFGNALVDPNLISTANDLATFLENRVGWGEDLNFSGYQSRDKDAELGVAAMIQYQTKIRENQMGIAGKRMESGLEKLLLEFAGTYPVSRPEFTIQAVQGKLDPLFEDGLRLSDHQRIASNAVEDDLEVDPKVSPEVEVLAKQLAKGWRGERQEPQAVQTIQGPRADDPWGMR